MDRTRLIAELVDLQDANNGVIAPRALWQRARNPKHWLHDRFEWDDGVAAERYRDEQAARLIRIVKIEPSPAPAVREFHPVKIGGGARSYQSLEDITSKATWTEQLRDRLRKEIGAQVARWVGLGTRCGLDVEQIIAEELRRNSGKAA